MVAFYKQDRLEPEPKKYVLGILILGALLASSIGQPVIQNSFRVQDWMGENWKISILTSIFVVGFVQEFLKYAAVRYTIYYSSEFDERVDGIIYAAAAGLGYATVLNLQYVIGNGGVHLGVGVLRITINALAQASFAGITGYFLGRAKFEDMGALWLPAGVTLAAVLNGIVTFVLNRAPSLGSTVRDASLNIWYSLIAAAIVAGVTFIVLFFLNPASECGNTSAGIQYRLKETGKLRSTLTNTAISTSVGKPEPEWVVWLTVGIALTIGFWLQLSVSRQIQSITLGDSTSLLSIELGPNQQRPNGVYRCRFE